MIPWWMIPIILLGLGLVMAIAWQRTRPRNASVVVPGAILRSGRLTPRTLRFLARRQGVRTVIDLGAYEPGSAEESRIISTAAALGIERHSIRGLRGNGAGNPNGYVYALRVLRDASAQPTLVMCAAGADRTGACIALYRHLVEAKPLDQALEESLEHRHDPVRNPAMHEFVHVHAPAIAAALTDGLDITGWPAADVRVNPVEPHLPRNTIARPASDERAPTPAWLQRSARWHWLIVLVAAGLVYWPLLGSQGLRSTEGHRAIPAWETLETGRWLPTTMFEAVYIRKPPGMPWAIALSSVVLGETEFAARAVSAASATAMALLAWFFAARWFGGSWGLAAGLAQALMPRFFTAGRSADIEALHCLAAQALAFVLIDALVARPRGGSRRVLMLAAAGAAALAVMLLAKAHAGLPVLAGVVGAACLVQRSWRQLSSLVLWGALIGAAALVAPVGIKYAELLSGQSAVSEDFGKFMWDASRLGKLGLMPAAVFIAALPASLAFLFPWGPDARAEGDPRGNAGAARARMVQTARALAIAAALGVGVYMLFGVSNERYAMPVLVLLPPLAAYVARGAYEFFTPKRRMIARIMLLGSPFVLPAGLLIGAAVNILVLEPHDARSSARPAAPALARAIPDGAEVWADGFVGAKPELLWYARREARAGGRDFRPVWKHNEVGKATLPPPGTLLLLNLVELRRYEEAGHDGALEKVTEGTADTTPFVLMRVRGR